MNKFSHILHTYQKWKEDPGQPLTPKEEDENVFEAGFQAGLQNPLEWHELAERPEDDAWILVQDEQGHYGVMMTDKDDYSLAEFNKFCEDKAHHMTRWAYIEKNRSTKIGAAE